MAVELQEEQRSLKLRKRLWGATVLIAVAVLVLPLLLDGSGSESQFRRVEKLREEPPRIVNAGDSLETGPVLQSKAPAISPPVVVSPVEAELTAIADQVWSKELEPIEPLVNSAGTSESLVAWVVQAGSYRQEANAIAVRDRLRRAGYPSFVAAAQDRSDMLYRVQVGPMIDQERAALTRNKVVSLLGREAIVVRYP
ncbi:MAG: SPOR domain-containing protein [Gammaproteobacteria bacterium]|nr:SPOR domain-containing protein [Gammaproteobacteria bacterium]